MNKKQIFALLFALTFSMLGSAQDSVYTFNWAEAPKNYFNFDGEKAYAARIDSCGCVPKPYRTSVLLGAYIYIPPQEPKIVPPEFMKGGAWNRLKFECPNGEVYDSWLGSWSEYELWQKVWDSPHSWVFYCVAAASYELDSPLMTAKEWKENPIRRWEFLWRFSKIALKVH